MLGFVIGIIIIILTEFIHVLCFSRIINEPLNLKVSKICVLIIISFLNAFNNYFNLFLFKIISSLILLIILNYFWFKKGLKKTIILSFIISVVSIILEFVLAIFMSFMFQNAMEVNQNLLAKNCHTIIFACVLYFIFTIKPFTKALNKVSNYLSNSMVIEIFLLLVVIIINILLVRYQLDYKNNFNLISNIIILLILAILLVICLKVNYNKQISEIKSLAMQEKINSYEKMADEYRELKHNLNADLLAIKSVANNEAQKIIDIKIKKYNKNYSWLTNIEKVPKGLQGLIYSKMNLIKKLKITIKIENEAKIDIVDLLSLKTYANICDIISILLDNAIEAAKDSKDKIIYIIIQNKEKNLFIKIINTFSNEIDVDKIGKKNYSTKTQKTGIGLNYVNRYRKNIGIKKEIINNLFIISLKVPY